MKKLALFCLLLLPFAAKAQVYRMYVDEWGKKVKNQGRADGYILYEKLDADSCWHMQHFDMQNRLKTTGTYKDQSLTIAEGKFVYYGYFKTTVKTENGYEPDSGVFKTGIGYFINGRETGIWQRLNYHGVLIARQAFVNGKRNGLYRHYDDLGRLTESGQYTDDKKDGLWQTFKMDSVIALTEIYRNGSLIKSIKNSNVIEADPGYDFNHFVAEDVTGKISVGEKNGVTVSFTVKKDGSLVNPVILQGLNVRVDKAVIDALYAAPKWRPATINKETVEQVVVKNIVLHNMVKDNIVDRIVSNVNDPDKVNPRLLHGVY